MPRLLIKNARLVNEGQITDVNEVNADGFFAP